MVQFVPICFYVHCLGYVVYSGIELVVPAAFTNASSKGANLRRKTLYTFDDFTSMQRSVVVMFNALLRHPIEPQTAINFPPGRVRVLRDAFLAGLTMTE
jgi:hypothetical protein